MNGGTKEVGESSICPVPWLNVWGAVLVGGNTYYDWYSLVNNLLPIIGC